MPSNAVPQNAVSTVVGYLLAKGYFNPNSPFLPQNITILGEANSANQSGLAANVAQQITNAQQAATLYGYGSPIHSMARILFPQSGQGVTVPVTVYPQAETGAAKVITITPSGNATASGTIYLNINGRETLDGGTYAVNIVSGDTPTVQSTKMQAAVAAVLGCPVIGSGTATFIATTKWKGLTANDVNITVDLNNSGIGVTYAVVNTTPGTGTPSVSTTLYNFGTAWNTIVINGYGLVANTITELETYNGVPDPIAPTGQYAGTIMRPMWAFSGSVADDPTSITNAAGRVNQVTIAVCPAPLSQGMPYEAAANMAVLCANVFQNSPQSDVIGLNYPDMPVPPAGSVPAMNSWAIRDAYAKKGCSTVEVVAGAYSVRDFKTTYNTAGEYPPFYQWVRDLNVHFNLKFRYHVKEQQVLVGKVISKNSDVVTALNVIKPMDWVTEVSALIDGAVADALIVDAAFSKSSIAVSINSTNPNRLDTTFNVKISGVARISATTVTGGFNFSN
jgi:phage tail sheath gpL-like